MLSDWKNWISDRLRRSAPRRRRATPRCRGQLESLESRNVLSVAIGVLSLDVIAVRVEPTSVTIFAVAEFEPIQEAMKVFHSFHSADDDHFDPRGTLAVNSPFNKRQFFAEGRPSGMLAGRMVSTAPNGQIGNFLPVSNVPTNIGNLAAFSGGDIEKIVDGGSPNGGNAMPVRATSDVGVVSNSDRQALNIPTIEPPLQGRFFATRINSVAGTYLSTAVTTTPETGGSNSLAQTALNNHDAAFESFDSDALLLAIYSDWDDDTLSADAKDELAALSNSDDGGESTAEQVVAGDLAQSLDTLEREEAAVDAVLAELHDIKLGDRGDSSGDSNQLYRHPSDAQSREFAERFFMAHGAEAAPTSHDASGGGMILLAATGDANSSMFDLAPTSGAAFAERAIASATVDAPVGLYQAVDVGVRPTATATAEISSIAKSDAIASR